jgi:hypothetical protein
MPVRALKVLVVVMGVMFVVGFAALIAVMAGRLSRGGSTATKVFTAPPIDLPAGAHVETLSVGSDRLVVDVALPGGNRDLVIIDLATGRRLGVVPLRTAP